MANRRFRALLTLTLTLSWTLTSGSSFAFGGTLRPKRHKISFAGGARLLFDRDFDAASHEREMVFASLDYASRLFALGPGFFWLEQSAHSTSMS